MKRTIITPTTNPSSLLLLTTTIYILLLLLLLTPTTSQGLQKIFKAVDTNIRLNFPDLELRAQLQKAVLKNILPVKQGFVAHYKMEDGSQRKFVVKMSGKGQIQVLRNQKLGGSQGNKQMEGDKVSLGVSRVSDQLVIKFINEKYNNILVNKKQEIISKFLPDTASYQYTITFNAIPIFARSSTQSSSQSSTQQKLNQNYQIKLKSNAKSELSILRTGFTSLPKQAQLSSFLKMQNLQPVTDQQTVSEFYQTFVQVFMAQFRKIEEKETAAGLGAMQMDSIMWNLPYIGVVFNTQLMGKVIFYFFYDNVERKLEFVRKQVVLQEKKGEESNMDKSVVGNVAIVQVGGQQNKNSNNLQNNNKQTAIIQTNKVKIQQSGDTNTIITTTSATNTDITKNPDTLHQDSNNNKPINAKQQVNKQNVQNSNNPNNNNPNNNHNSQQIKNLVLQHNQLKPVEIEQTDTNEKNTKKEQMKIIEKQVQQKLVQQQNQSQQAKILANVQPNQNLRINIDSNPILNYNSDLNPNPNHNPNNNPNPADINPNQKNYNDGKTVITDHRQPLIQIITPTSKTTDAYPGSFVVVPTNSGTQKQKQVAAISTPIETPIASTASTPNQPQLQNYTPIQTTTTTAIHINNNNNNNNNKPYILQNLQQTTIPLLPLTNTGKIIGLQTGSNKIITAPNVGDNKVVGLMVERESSGGVTPAVGGAGAAGGGHSNVVMDFNGNDNVGDGTITIANTGINTNTNSQSIINTNTVTPPIIINSNPTSHDTSTSSTSTSTPVQDKLPVTTNTIVNPTKVIDKQMVILTPSHAQTSLLSKADHFVMPVSSSSLSTSTYTSMPTSIPLPLSTNKPVLLPTLTPTLMPVNTNTNTNFSLQKQKPSSLSSNVLIPPVSAPLQAPTPPPAFTSKVTSTPTATATVSPIFTSAPSSSVSSSSAHLSFTSQLPPTSSLPILNNNKPQENVVLSSNYGLGSGSGSSSSVVSVAQQSTTERKVYIQPSNLQNQQIIKSNLRKTGEVLPQLIMPEMVSKIPQQLPSPSPSTQTQSQSSPLQLQSPQPQPYQSSSSQYFYQQQTDQNCSRYKSGICIACYNRFYPNQKTKKCQPIPEQCQQYNKITGTCTRCYTGYVLRAGRCSNVDYYCAKMEDDGRCVRCYPGFVLGGVGGKCKSIY